jgi:hypothetical protein
MLSTINWFNTHVSAVYYTVVSIIYVPGHPCDCVLLYLKHVGSRYGTWSMLSWWCLESWGGSKSSGKFVDPCSDRLSTNITLMAKPNSIWEITLHTMCLLHNLLQIWRCCYQSKWVHSLRHGSASTHLLGLWVWILMGAWMPVPCECYMVLVRGLCVGLFANPEESYRVWVCLSVIMKPHGQGGPGPLGTIKPQKQNWRCW